MTLAVLTLASLFAGHELTYVLAHGWGDGYARAMSAGGHDDYWLTFVVVVGALVIASTGIVYRQIRRLSMAADPGTVIADAGIGAFAHLLVRIWVRVALLTAGLFLFQENYELWNAGGSWPLLDVVSGDHWLALPVLIAVSSLVSIVGTLVGWRRLILEARARRAVRFSSKPPLARRGPEDHRRRPLQALISHGLRAPPLGAAVTAP